MDKNIPYNELPLISTIYVEESMELLRLAEDTRVALSVLDYAVKHLPNENIILDNILWQEAKSSSAVENIVTTNDELYKGIASQHMTPEVKEVMSYKNGLYLGYQKMLNKEKLLSISDIIAINTSLNKGEKGLRSNTPDFSSGMTRIAAFYRDGTSKTLYTPPHGRDVLNRLLMDMLEFIYNDERFSLHPLLKIALAHYQFECIHPFFDGNGRTGRILNILFLCNKEYLTKPLLYASSFIVKNKSKYYELLNKTTDTQNYNAMIMYMLQCFLETAKDTLNIAEKITSLYEKYTSTEFLRDLTGNKENIRLAINLSFIKTYIRIKDLEEAGLHRQTAAKILERLQEAGLLEVEEKDKCKIYKNIELLKLFGGKTQ